MHISWVERVFAWIPQTIRGNPVAFLAVRLGMPVFCSHASPFCLLPDIFLSKTFFLFKIYACVWGCVHMCVWVAVHVWRPEVNVVCFLLFLSPLVFESASSHRTRSLLFDRKTGYPAPRTIHLHSHHWGYRHTSPFLASLWVLEIPT